MEMPSQIRRRLEIQEDHHRLSEADRALAETRRIIQENYHNSLLETLRRQNTKYEPPAQ